MCNICGVIRNIIYKDEICGVYICNLCIDKQKLMINEHWW